MLSKILRTIIGMPFVLVAWPAYILIGCILIIGWAITDSDIAKEGALNALIIPYQFIKKVWK